MLPLKREAQMQKVWIIIQVMTASIWLKCLTVFYSEATVVMSYCHLIAESRPTLCDPMDCSMPGFLVLHCLPEFAQVHVHWVGEAMLCNHLIPHRPLLFLPSTFLSIKVFSNWSEMTMFCQTCPSWVALNSMARSFIELHKPLCHNKAVIHEGGECLTKPYKMI